jgi:hypothetical protein
MQNFLLGETKLRAAVGPAVLKHNTADKGIVLLLSTVILRDGRGGSCRNMGGRVSNSFDNFSQNFLLGVKKLRAAVGPAVLEHNTVDKSGIVLLLSTVKNCEEKA